MRLTSSLPGRLGPLISCRSSLTAFSRSRRMCAPRRGRKASRLILTAGREGKANGRLGRFGAEKFMQVFGCPASSAGPFFELAPARLCQLTGQYIKIWQRGRFVMIGVACPWVAGWPGRSERSVGSWLPSFLLRWAGCVCAAAEMQPTVALSRLYAHGMWSEENAIPFSRMGGLDFGFLIF